MPARMLLIDDDTDDRDLFCEAVYSVSPGTVCDCAFDCPGALHQLAHAGLLPDLIFLDINLPVISGWECLRRLKSSERLRQIPVIVYSTSSHERDRELALELGALTFFSKPHDFETLKKKMDLIIRHVERHSVADLQHMELS